MAMLIKLYDTTVEFFALRNLTPSPGGQISGDTHPNPSHPSQRTLPEAPDPIGREELDERGGSNSDPPHMRRGLEDITNQLARSRAEVAKLEERCRGLEKALRGTREMLKAREMELESMRKVGGTSSMIKETHADEQWQTKSEGSQNRLVRTDTGSSSSSMVSEEHRALLRSNEIYMTRTDSWSGAQVIQAVHDLNSEIIQFAASAIELCTVDPNSPGSPQAIHDTSARLGPNLASLLSARERNSQDPTLVGLALQAGMTTCIARAMNSFVLGLPSKSDVILSQVYSHVFIAEPQPTSSRWRAITHRYVHALYPGLTEYAAEELRETICRWTSDILVGACATNEATSRAWIRENFGEQVGRMVKAVTGIAQICKEEIMSTNFDLLVIEPGQAFDERMMFDAFGEYGVSHGAVLATTELGLKRMSRRDDRTGVEQQLLVKPKWNRVSFREGGIFPE
ncbi:hypothetical protein C8R45DRAFT_1088242 [Mycena sanguinolenta]|nr:hypothetical protein C8R45DRAFT_1088242 [Mycena sanguinolenta]